MANFGNTFRKAVMSSSRPLGEIKSATSAVKSSGVAQGARNIASSLAKDMKTGKGIAKMAGTSVAGGAAGYAMSDDRDKVSGAIKGAGFGALAGAGWVAGGNSKVRSTLSSGYSGAKSQASRIGGEISSDMSRVDKNTGRMRDARVLGGHGGGSTRMEPPSVDPSRYSVKMNQGDINNRAKSMVDKQSGQGAYNNPDNLNFNLKTSSRFKSTNPLSMSF